MPRPTRILTWLMLVMLVGGHWGMLQVVAWTGMLIDYSRDATLAEAWDQTFDGEHPCALCKAVECGIRGDGDGDERRAPGMSCKIIKLDALVTPLVLMTSNASDQRLVPVQPLDVLVGCALEPRRRPPRAQG